jgi:hypothetical protein
LKKTLIYFLLTFAAAISTACGETRDWGLWKIHFDESGLNGLANPEDPFQADLIANSQHVRLITRYRLGGGDWQEPPAPTLQAASNSIVFSSAAAPLSLTQRFQTNGNSLDWIIELEATGIAPVEIGDLGIKIPIAGPQGENPERIFEHGFLKHQFIEGYGSFLYYVRASGAPPFLVVTVHPGTKLEYFSATGREDSTVFIHSGLAGGEETRGTWRQEHTFLHLDPASAKHKTATYGFSFHWANSYDEMRAILYDAGLFDIRVVPGMTIPTDLSARFALHTKAKIESIVPEFPHQTKIRNLGEASPGCHIYAVEFERLGENKLTIVHDGGRQTFLEFFVTEPLETLIKKRASFLVERQQIRDPSKWWDGVFGPYDMKHGLVRTIEDPDIFKGRMVYVLTCDDPGLCKAPFVAEKNVSFPNAKEIGALEYYLRNFVWGRLQRTDQENPYPYGVYGTPNWHTDRDPELRAKISKDNLDKMHVWRSYDYPHMVMLYFHMYEIARAYPHLTKYLDASGYLERAYQTARAFFIYPYEIFPSYYETYKWGLYNELIVLRLADALDENGFADRAAWLRAEWEKKVKYFVYDDRYPFRSEYAFDRTAFESTYAFAKYGATHDMLPDTNLWYDVKSNKWYSHPVVKREDSLAFMRRQLASNLSVRGWLEASYYQLGADPGLSYMAAMGGWGILDYGLNFADQPWDWLQLGYASYLSSWCLVNSGTPENNYGFWNPGQTNDGAAGWQFMSAKFGHAWMGADVPRGPWPYDGEIDLGFGGALRSSATVLTKDPIFGWMAYGGALQEKGDSLAIIPRDGLRRRFDAVLDGSKHLNMELDRDGFAKEKDIIVSKKLHQIKFVLENRTGDAHDVVLKLSPPAGAKMRLKSAHREIDLLRTGDFDYPQRALVHIEKNSLPMELTDEN